MGLQDWMAVAAQIMEVAGAVSIVGGSLVALVMALVRSRAGSAGLYASFRGDLARSILLGLELLVGGDIIRTITTTPSILEVVVLAIIVLIRTLLSFTLQLEVTGRWPWEERSR